MEKVVTSGGKLGREKATLGSHDRGLGVGELVPRSLLGDHLSRGRDVKRVGEHVGVAVLGALRRVQLPEVARHLSHVVQAGLGRSRSTLPLDLRFTWD